MSALIALWWAKTWKYVAAFGAILLTAIGLYEKGRIEGKAKESQINVEAQAKANAQAIEQTTKVQESRNETDAVIASLPVAPPQTVATADPATAAGQLRDDGWVRPDDGS